MKHYETPVLSVLSVENEDVLTMISGGANGDMLGFDLPEH